MIRKQAMLKKKSWQKRMQLFLFGFVSSFYSDFSCNMEFGAGCLEFGVWRVWRVWTMELGEPINWPDIEQCKARLSE